MRFFNNLPIARKVLLALAIMGASAHGTAWYAASNLARIDALYHGLLDHETKGDLWLARANIALLDEGRLLNRLISESDETSLRQTQRELAQVREQIAERLAGAVRYLPGITAEIRVIEEALARLAQVTAPIERAAMLNDNDTALRHLRDDRNPVFAETRQLLRELTERVDERAEQAARVASADAAFSWWTTVIAALSGVVISVALALWMMQAGLSRPIGRLAERMRALAGGEKASPVPGAGRGDEVGWMAEAVEGFRQAALEQERMAETSAAEQAAKAARARRVDALVRDFETEAADVLRTMASAAAELDVTAGQMQAEAGAGTERATSLAAASEEASANVASVAASTEEMAASVAEVARQVTESARVARQAADDARATDGAVSNLAEAAQRIGEVVRLISDIAGQTNLLALNATIEAARAGEAGRGFAVVASEVKTLAQQTARATEEIGAQISAMQAETGRAVEAIRKIAGTIESMDGLTAQVAAAAEEQAAATQEIGRAVSEAAAGTRDVSRLATGVTEGAQQTGVAAGQFRTASGDLSRRAESLRKQVDSFLADICVA